MIFIPFLRLTFFNPLYYLGFAGKPRAEEQFVANVKAVSELVKPETTLSITVVGASGDLARKKIFPALFALFYEDCLPEVLLFKSVIYDYRNKIPLFHICKMQFFPEPGRHPATF